MPDRAHRLRLRFAVALGLLLLAACGGEHTPVAPQLKASEPAGVIAATITIDATSYRYGASVPVLLTFRNTGQSTLWLRRACETADIPATQLVRPLGDSTPIFIGWGNPVCASSAPPYPEPIKLRPQEALSWTYNIRNSLPDAQSSAPTSWFTGDFRIVLLAQNTSRIVDSAGDLIALDLRTSPQFRIDPP
jgi:hypothetical protein